MCEGRIARLIASQPVAPGSVLDVHNKFSPSQFDFRNFKLGIYCFDFARIKARIIGQRGSKMSTLLWFSSSTKLEQVHKSHNLSAANNFDNCLEHF